MAALVGLLTCMSSFIQAQDKVSYVFQEALRLKGEQKYAEAFDLLRLCHELDPTDAGICYELSAFYQSFNDAATSLALLESAHANRPDNEWLTYTLASAYKDVKDWPRAIALLEELIDRNPERSSLCFPLSQFYLAQNNPKAALKALDRLENHIGANEAVTDAKCAIYDAMDQHAKALREIEKLARSQPDNAHLQLKLADAWSNTQAQGKARDKAIAKALDIINRETAAHADDGECLLALARLHLKCENESAVQSVLRQAIDRPGVDLETKLAAIGYFTRQKPQDSSFVHGAFLKVLEQYPEEYDIHQHYVIWLMEKGETELSKAELRNVLDMNPDQPDVWKDYLSLFLNENNVAQAEAVSREALTYFPDETVFWFYLAVSLSIEKNYQEAIDAYLEAAARATGDQKEFASECIGNAGDLCHELGDTLASYGYYDKALAIHPGNVLVLNNYAYFLCLEERELDRAEQMSRRAIRQEASNSTYLDTYAWVCFKRGNYKMARIYIERALLNLKEPHSEIYEHQGDILWFCDEKEAAAEAWKKALESAEEPSETLKAKAGSGEYTL